LKKTKIRQEKEYFSHKNKSGILTGIYSSPILADDEDICAYFSSDWAKKLKSALHKRKGLPTFLIFKKLLYMHHTYFVCFYAFGKPLKLSSYQLI